MILRNAFFYTTGIVFLALAKAKYILKGYCSPKPFDISELDRCIEYDIRVVEHWLSFLEKYTHRIETLAGKNILELGPGSDLGIGIYLLSKGCFQYNAFDVNDLMKSTPDSLYERLFQELENTRSQVDIDFLKGQLKEAQKGNPSRLNYVVHEGFDIVSAFGESTVDLVFSQAAFEHFDDIAATIVQLSRVCKPGAILVAEIDLRTHSRWIRDKDPNNIYRYPNHIYRLFKFRGSPNRVRPYQYKALLERSGWTDVSIEALTRLGDENCAYSGVTKAFADKKSQMDHLSVMLCATKRD